MVGGGVSFFSVLDIQHSYFLAFFQRYVKCVTLLQLLRDQFYSSVVPVLLKTICRELKALMPRNIMRRPAGQRSNSSVHVCWHRATSVAIVDHQATTTIHSILRIFKGMLRRDFQLQFSPSVSNFQTWALILPNIKSRRVQSSNFSSTFNVDALKFY